MILDEYRLPKVFTIYLKLSNLPILADRIRERMREELFGRGIVDRAAFEKEVEERALQSQEREGLNNPYGQESAEVWERRKRVIRDHLTDFYFGHNLPQRLLDDIIQEELRHRGHAGARGLDFNPELAPWDLLFAKGLQYEALPPEERHTVQHHLQEIKVVLIRAMISDQLGFLGVARDFFTVADLEEIRRRRIGRGKIGGKAAGLMLAWTILRRSKDPAIAELVQHMAIPESFFIGADVFYEFMDLNGLVDQINQKYKTPEQIIEDWTYLPERFARGHFPEYIVDQLRDLLRRLSPAPLIVRSSSLLEDNVNTSFAGKYLSLFCPNQGTLAENLQALLGAISQVYASALNPDALFYRRQVGLIDYDERMAIILQKVEGSEYKRRFFPPLAGVAFSSNPFLWTSRLRREDGFVRMVAGLGTRAVDRVPDDYPRMIGLSHPTLRPERDASKIRHYSQHYMDVLNLDANRLETLPVGQVIDEDYPWLRLLASAHRNNHLEPIVSSATPVSPGEMVLTIDGLLERTDFVARMKQLLKTLSAAYGCPVDVEFTVELRGSPREPELILHLLQCRPQSSTDENQSILVPRNVPSEDVLFSANHLIPNGVVPRIRTIVYVDPVQYERLALPADKLEVARVVGRINRALQGERFILMGPGRWGSSNYDLGVKVTYADIFNTRMLVEIGLESNSGAPEVSHGTHFFQDLVEAHIFPLAVFPQQPGTQFNHRFFAEAPNRLPELLPEDASVAPVVKVIDVPVAAQGRLLEVVMSAEESQALAYLKTYSD